MNFGDTYKTPLRSYIQSRVETLENNLEEVIKNRSNINANNLEQQIDRETNKFIDDVKKHVKNMQDDIKSHRPTDSNAPDYDIHMKRYEQFVQNSATGVNEVTNWIKSMFDKILSIVKTIVQWIKDNAKTIIEIIKDIRDAFKLINNFNKPKSFKMSNNATASSNNNFITGSSGSSTTTEIIHKKFKSLKTLVLKLKPGNRHTQDLSSMNPDQLDNFVDEMTNDLEKTVVSNINDLRERIKQARPDSNDPQYDNKMIAYQQLLEQMIPLIQKLQGFTSQILNELQSLIKQLWDDISKNDGKKVDRLLEEHQRRLEEHMNGEWMKQINNVEEKLQELRNMKY